MSKRNRKPAPGAAGGRGRSVPIQVKKSFPWGTVAVSVLLLALLGGIVGYAVANQGSGVRDLLKEDDKSFSGLRVEEEPARDHVNAPVGYEDYPSRPPLGGEHSSIAQSCQVYTEPIPPETAVHSLEHGAAWVTYRPDLDAEDVERLRDLVDGDPYRMMSPLPGQDSPVVLTAWGRQLEVDDASSRDVRRFLDVYTNGRQTPEKGAACVGSTATGSLPTGADPNDPGFMDQPEPEGGTEGEPAPAPTG
jgi:hypothetical protein